MSRRGAMRERIQFRLLSKAPDGGGGFTTAPRSAATHWASVRAVGSERVMRWRELGIDVTHVIETDMPADVDVKQGISVVWLRDPRDGGEVFLEVQRIEDASNRRRELKMYAKQIEALQTA